MLSAKRRRLVAVVVAALCVCSAASADPPSRVGRLNLLQGTVSFRPDGMDEWTAATLNYPLGAGDGLWTDEASRAEVHVASTAIRVGPQTEVSMLDLDDEAVQISLPQGRLSVRLRQLDSDESFEIDTPTVSISLLGPGSYRIDVRDGGDTAATVIEGEIEVVVDGLSYPVRERQSALVAGSDSPSIRIRRAPAGDEWDRWCAERDSREDRLSSAAYVPRAMTGCEDLDWYGTWRVTVDYGAVWIPSSLPAGWAPYRFGRWAWVEPWGWTWIDDAAWGFAPFHYGRWTLAGGVWVWVPGTISYRPVYAPALVVFIEAGPGSAALNGRIGWFPLGPREAYAPPYRASRDYIQRLNIMHVRIGDAETIDMTRTRYVNRDRAGALTAVSRQSFGRAERVGDSRDAIPDREFPGARVRGTAAGVTPQRESVLASSRASDRPVSRPPERTRERPVVVRKVPSAGRQPFSAEAKDLEEHPARPTGVETREGRKDRAPSASPWVRQRSRTEESGSRNDPRDSRPAAPQAQQGAPDRPPQPAQRAQQDPPDRASPPEQRLQPQRAPQDRTPPPTQSDERGRDKLLFPRGRESSDSE